MAGEGTRQVRAENELHAEPARGRDVGVDPIALGGKEQKEPFRGGLGPGGIHGHLGAAFAAACEAYYVGGESPSAMRVVLFAWCPTATSYLDALVAAGAAPVLLVTGPRSPEDGALAVRAASHGVLLERTEDVNAVPFVERIRSLAPDLLLIAGCSQILRAPLRSAARLGVVNFHPSLLPNYRGKEPLFWAILQGETRTGCTAHHATDAVDAGPILLQREVPISRRATSASLARDVDEAGATLVPELLAMARAGALPPGQLPAEPGKVFPPLRPEHGLLDLSRGAIELDRLVRACAGEIPAFCFVHGMKVVLLEGEPSEAACSHGAPGTVVEIGGGSARIATAAGDLVARRWLFFGRAHDSDELAVRLDIGVGTRFTGNPAFR
jgi:methionyl-tRNA formyltransferase